ncbi:hypothetical protein D3C75_358830 [compost metagenome]
MTIGAKIARINHVLVFTVHLIGWYRDFRYTRTLGQDIGIAAHSGSHRKDISAKLSSLS